MDFGIIRATPLQSMFPQRASVVVPPAPLMPLSLPPPLAARSGRSGSREATPLPSPPTTWAPARTTMRGRTRMQRECVPEYRIDRGRKVGRRPLRPSAMTRCFRILVDCCFSRRSIAIDAGAGRWIAGVRTDRGSRRRCRCRPSHPPTSPSEFFRYHRRCEGAGDIVLVVLLLWSLQRARATAIWHDE